MPHWHDHNPWADRVVYVPIERLAACAVAPGDTVETDSGAVVPYTAEYVLEHWRRQGGERLDAYLLPGPTSISAGVRHGPEGSQYFSPQVRDRALAERLIAEARAEAEPEADHGSPFAP